MINAVLSMAFRVFLLLGTVWFVLALLSARWPSLKPLYRGYLALLKACLMGLFHLLWAPRSRREGGGQIAHPRIPHKEKDPWV